MDSLAKKILGRVATGRTRQRSSAAGSKPFAAGARLPQTVAARRFRGPPRRGVLPWPRLLVAEFALATPLVAEFQRMHGRSSRAYPTTCTTLPLLWEGRPGAKRLPWPRLLVTEFALATPARRRVSANATAARAERIPRPAQRRRFCGRAAPARSVCLVATPAQRGVSTPKKVAA